MSELMRTSGQSAAQSIEQVLVGGDLSRLTAEQRVSYVNRLCESLGLNPLTRPFEFIPLNGKLVCYATRACSEQLRKINSVSVLALERRHIAEMGLFEVVARGRDKTGREDESSAVLSIGGLKGSTEIGAYCISKAADMQLARNLACEWGPDNIRVNCIAPGLIKTDFAKALHEDPVMSAKYNSQAPMRRMGEADDIGGIAVFLASPAANYVTGQTVVADGGMMIR
jgi:NAD(P)-dependent dehydrogenase (short-subunit alcohol dehydrogenase family)